MWVLDAKLRFSENWLPIAAFDEGDIGSELEMTVLGFRGERWVVLFSLVDDQVAGVAQERE